MPNLKQVGALPIRPGHAGGLQVLLVTSRESQRWVIPKGWPWPQLPDHEAAAGEAWEEAGVRGHAVAAEIGIFAYEKRQGGKLLPIEVVVYLLEVTEEVETWPEANERRRAWFDLNEAVEAVAEPELKALLQSLAR